MLLADLGADVVRVDRPGGGTKLLPSTHDILWRGKRSVVVDLAQPDGAVTVLDLVESADVLIEGFRPGVAERLGIGPDECWTRNRALVYGRMTGWGQDGPRAAMAGHDLAYIAPTGVLAATGPAGAAPAVPLNLYGDMGGGAMYLVVGILAALLEARVSGTGQVVDAAIVDGVSHLNAMVHAFWTQGLWRLERGSNLIDGGCPFYDTYRCSDGGFVAVGALEPQFFAELARLLEVEVDLARQNDPRTWPELRQVLTERFATRSRAEWMAVFDGTDACVAPVLDLAEAAGDPHLAARSTYTEIGGVLQPAPAPRFSRTAATVDRQPPELGSSDPAQVIQAWRTAPVTRARQTAAGA
jgi:alpha-methylacyl-CoA racemase